MAYKVFFLRTDVSGNDPARPFFTSLSFCLHLIHPCTFELVLFSWVFKNKFSLNCSTFKLLNFYKHSWSAPFDAKLFIHLFLYHFVLQFIHLIYISIGAEQLKLIVTAAGRLGVCTVHACSLGIRLVISHSPDVTTFLGAPFRVLTSLFYRVLGAQVKQAGKRENSGNRDLPI